MKSVYQPAVRRDVPSILRHYNGINDGQGEEFLEEFSSLINKAAINPHRFHFETRDRLRVSLRRFTFTTSFFGKFPAAFTSPSCAAKSNILTVDSNGGNRYGDIEAANTALKNPLVHRWGW